VFFFVCKLSLKIGATTLNITTVSLTILGLTGLFATLGINDTQHNSFECLYAEFLIFIGMLSVVLPNGVMLNVVTMRVVNLNVSISEAIKVRENKRIFVIIIFL